MFFLIPSKFLIASNRVVAKSGFSGGKGYETCDPGMMNVSNM